MIGNITLGQYIPGKSPLHRLDPRTKILWTMVLMIAAFIMDTWQEFAMMGVFTVILLMISNIPLKHSLKGIKPLLFILALTAVLNIFFIPGTPLFTIGPVTVSQEGIVAAIRIFFRLVMLVVIASLMTLTTTPMAMTDGIESLIKPLEKIRVPAHEIAMMMSIALRFIPTLLEETERIMKAQASRGADFDTGSLFKRVRSFIPVLVPLFVSAFKRADELAEAMEARCYRGGTGRTRLHKIKYGAIDLEATLFGILFLALVFGMRVMKF